MTTTRLTLMAIRSTVLGALLVGFASMAIAQGTKPPAGPPRTTKGTLTSSPRAEKGQEMAESKRVEARREKAERAGDKLQNEEQRTALKVARNEPKALLKGIKLTPAERTSLKAIEKRYAVQLKDLEKQARIAEKAGQADPSVASRIHELRTRERAEVRGGLQAEWWPRFDRNVSAYGARKH